MIARTSYINYGSKIDVGAILLVGPCLQGKSDYIPRSIGLAKCAAASLEIGNLNVRVFVICRLLLYVHSSSTCIWREGLELTAMPLRSDSVRPYTSMWSQE